MPRSVTALTLILIIVGGVNWLLVGLFEFDLVATIVGEDFGDTNIVSRIIYILVGIAALIQLVSLGRVLAEDDSRR